MPSAKGLNPFEPPMRYFRPVVYSEVRPRCPRGGALLGRRVREGGGFLIKLCLM